MTLLDFAKLAVRKRMSNMRNPAVTSALPTGAKKEDTQDKYNDYDKGPAPQDPQNNGYNSYTGGELK